MMLRYFWDFFGPHAEGTALHFTKHVNEFLAKHDLLGCQTGTLCVIENKHYTAWCDTPEAIQDTISQSLRPKRWEEK